MDFFYWLGIVVSLLGIKYLGVILEMAYFRYLHFLEVR
jgi:hypothetical protein